MNPFLWNWQIQLLVQMSRSIKIPFIGVWGWVFTWVISMKIVQVMCTLWHKHANLHGLVSWLLYMVKILLSFIPKWSPKWFLKNDDIRDEQCWWFALSKHDWVSSNWHWWILWFLVECNHHSVTWKILEDFLYASIGHWSNIFHLGSNSSKFKKNDHCSWGIMGMCKESINYFFFNLHVNVSSAFYGT